MEGTSTNAGKVAFEHVWEGLGKQVCVAEPCKNTVYPIGVLGVGYSGVFLKNQSIWVFWGLLFVKTPCHVAWELCFVIIC